MAKHNIILKILVIGTNVITSDCDFGSLRMRQILSLLASAGHHVTFAASNLEYRASYLEDLQAKGICVVRRPYYRSLNQLLDERGKELDLVILSRFVVAAQWLYAVRKTASKAFVVFDAMDLRFFRMVREAELRNDEQAKKKAEAQKMQELALMRATNQTWVTSSEEKNGLAQMVPDVDTVLLSNIHMPEPKGKSFDHRAGILFMGSFRHPLNIDAMLWYSNEVLPLLRHLLPNVISTIIGGDIPSSVKALASSDVVVTGDIENIAPYFAVTRVFIAPSRYSANVKEEIDQAMSFGVPVVTTSIAAEGMYLVDGENALIADDAQAFAEAIERVYQDESLWRKIAQAGRAKLIPEACAQETMEAVLRRIVAKIYFLT
ncbi:MAG: glycosyltransferase family 4 protein [Burkholderiales bacterium]|nr:glycosyltransferase family 4 protein [Burkholderiales bacterium]